MENAYLESLAADFRRYADSDRVKAEAASNEIAKILGPMSKDEEEHYFGRAKQEDKSLSAVVAMASAEQDANEPVE